MSLLQKLCWTAVIAVALHLIMDAVLHPYHTPFIANIVFVVAGFIGVEAGHRYWEMRNERSNSPKPESMD